MSLEVAALFVETNGCYFGLPNVYPWDVAKDARRYAGPWPVVAHPPCQLWGRFAVINYKRWGGDHNRPGNDGGCFESALNSVRAYGGVLEHPAFSKAWDKFGLPKPVASGWQSDVRGDWVCEVWQSAYGHRARKRTWLYYRGQTPHELNWERVPGSHQCGHRDQRGKEANKPTLSSREASATPPLFRDALLRLVFECNT